MERARAGVTAARAKDARHSGRRGAPVPAVVLRTGWGGVSGDGTAVPVQAPSEMRGAEAVIAERERGDARHLSVGGLTRSDD